MQESSKKFGIQRGKGHSSGDARREENPESLDNVRSLWDNFKCTNIRIMGMPEEREREQDTENLFEEIMTENFPHLVKDVHPYDCQLISQQKLCRPDGSGKKYSK